MPHKADQPTIIITHVMSYLAFTTIIIRSCIRRYRRERFIFEDYLMMSSVLWLFMRLSLIHHVLIWGTNNMSEATRAQGFTDKEIWHRSVASKMLLANRFAYNTFLWNMKACLLLFYRCLTVNIPTYSRALFLVWIIMGISYVIVQVLTFSECKPFALYWQVVPSPGKCVQAQVQLFVLGGLNIFTDVLLIIFPLPALWRAKMPTTRKIQLGLLFCVGFFVVAVTVVRLPQNSKNKSLQKNRTTWASVEAFAACFVANAPTIYTLYRHRRPSEQPRVKPLPPNSNLNSERGSSKKTKKSWYSKNDSLMNDTVVTMTTDTQVDGVDGKSDFHMENLVPSNRRSGTFPKNSLMRSESGEELTSPGNGTFDEERLVVRTRRDFVMQEELVECSTSERSVDLGLKQQTETRIWSVPNQ